MLKKGILGCLGLCQGEEAASLIEGTQVSSQEVTNARKPRQGGGGKHTKWSVKAFSVGKREGGVF